MSAIFARGQNGVNGGQNFKMPQSLQNAHQITCLVVQNLKKYSLSYLWPFVKLLLPQKWKICVPNYVFFNETKSPE